MATVALGLAAVVSVAGCGRNEFVPYAPTADVVPALGDGSRIKLGGISTPFIDDSCNAGEMFDPRDQGPNMSEWRQVNQIFQEPDRSRIVAFATQRFETGQAFDEQMDHYRTGLGQACIAASDNDDAGNADDKEAIAPESLDGLPVGAATAHWQRDGGDGWTTVVGDRDRQIMMIVVWVERPEVVPVDSFVGVVNAAWSEFESDNS